MKIMMVYPIYDFYGGAGGIVGGHIAHIIGIAEALISLQHEIVICGYDKTPFLEKVKFRRLGNPKIPGDKLKKLVVLHCGYKELINAVTLEMPDLVYIRWCGLLHMEKVKDHFPKLPIIAECNTPAELSMANAFPKWLMHFWGRQADQGFINASQRIVVVSKAVKNYLSKKYSEYPSKNILVVPNGVDCNRFGAFKSSIREKLQLSDDVFLLGFTGNFAPWHRIDLIVSALADLPNNVCLLLVGTGPRGILDSIHRQARGLGCENRILFAGTVPFVDISKYINACDVMILPQDKNQPHRSSIKLFEYMASQKPIIAANVGQVVDIIDHGTNGTNGLLFEPDSIEDLVEKIIFLKDNPALREKLAINARKDAEEKHSWKNRAQMILRSLD